jgi:GTP cyclohydrolase I
MGLKVYSLIILCEHHILGMQMDTSNAYILHNSTTSFILFFF